MKEICFICYENNEASVSVSCLIAKRQTVWIKTVFRKKKRLP